jgi:hypothetical protein
MRVFWFGFQVSLYLILAGSAASSSIGSAVTAAQIQDFRVSFSASTATVSCGSCSYRIGGTAYLLSGNKAASTLTGNGTAGTVFFYLDPGGNVDFGYDGTIVTGATLSGLIGITGITSFPADTIPLASCGVLGNAFVSCTDFRAIMGQSVSTAGNGILLIVNPSTGKVSYAVNPAVVGILGGPNLWTGNNDFSTAAHTTPSRVGTLAAKPSTCTVGELYFASDQTAGQNLYGCTSANTWTAE